MSDFDDDEPGDETPAADAEPTGTGDKAGKGRRPAAEDDWDDDDWDDDDDDRGGRRDMTLIVVIAVAVAVIALVVILTRPKDKDDTTTTTTPGGVPSQTTTKDDGGFACDEWPAVVGGNGSNATKGEGLYIWSDFQGFHVRSNRTDAIVVKVTGPADIKVKDKGNAQASSTAGPEVTLTIPAGDGKAGPDLDLSCNVTTVNFEVSAGGQPLAPADIKLGDSGKADANPVSLVRGQP